MINNQEFENKVSSRQIIGKLQKDFKAFNSLMEERMQIMKDELEELSFLNNKELMEGIKKSEEDFKAGRLVRCNTEEEIEKHFESLWKVLINIVMMGKIFHSDNPVLKRENQNKMPDMLSSFVFRIFLNGL